MWEELIKLMPIYFSSMLKFVFGPALGVAMKVYWLKTTILTVAGMMTSVFLLSFFDEKIVLLLNKIPFNRKAKNKVFTSRKRMFVRVWRRGGAFGVAFLTPILFSPILGTLLLISFRTERKKIFFYMFFSAVFWGIILSNFFSEIANLLS